MSNLDALKKGYEAFERGDIDAAFATFDPECTFRGGSASLPAGGTYHGIDEIRGRWLAEFAANFEDWRFAPEQFLESADGTAVTILGTVRARVRGGDEIKSDVAHVWRYNAEGKAIEARFFGDSAQTAKALEAVGEKAAT